MMDYLDSVSYDQYADIPILDDLGIKTKIIFTEECYNAIKDMITKTKKINIEAGAFFVGRRSKEDAFTILIDYMTSEFQSTNAFVEGGAVEPSLQNYNELKMQISKTLKAKEQPIIFHFHTHPRKLHYESFSDQDLNVYANMQLENPQYINFGMLGFPIPNKPAFGLCVVRAIKPQLEKNITSAEFYMYPNIYYCMGEGIYKISKVAKSYQGRKHKAKGEGSKIIRNRYPSPNTKAKICKIEVNEKQNNVIKDECVGYIDTNSTLYFKEESSPFHFTKINKKVR
jgi:hypothetical protein